MAVKVISAGFTGIEGVIVSVEVDVSRGLPAFNIVGLADTSVKESKERVRAAIINSEFDFPVGRITVNLAPADLKKEGSLFDLPIAVGILLATNQIDYDWDKYLIIGELSLVGEIKAVRGALPIVLEGITKNINNFIIPMKNVKESSIVKEAKIFPFENLKEVTHYLTYKDLMPFKYNAKKGSQISGKKEVDFMDIISQESSKRAVEIAAAGNHNILMFGPPGSGKTMIAERIPTILPKLSYKEAIECTKIYSVSGNLKGNDGLILERPFRSPHHTSSKIALVGGGNKLMPGEISLAHNGVLFLDETLEFKKSVLEVLRQPLEDRSIKISKASGTIKYPSNFMLVCSLNPCPCGNFGVQGKECICSDYERKRYLSRLSAPLLSRIDIFTFVNPIKYKDIKNYKKSESSKNIQARVEKARRIQKERFKQDKIYTNAEMGVRLIKKYCCLNKKAARFMENVYDKFNLSARAYTRILKVSRTIADLDERENIEDIDIIEAFQYRKFIDNKII